MTKAETGFARLPVPRCQPREMQIMIDQKRNLLMLAAFLTAALVALTSEAQPGAPGAGGTGPGGRGGGGRVAAQVTSPEVSADRHVTFRILAPQAQTVRVSSSDMAAFGGGTGAMTKSTNGTWEVTVGPVMPVLSLQLQRGRRVGDRPAQPRHERVQRQHLEPCRSDGSGLHGHEGCPPRRRRGGDLYSKSLNYFRRMHVYTPPGYEDGKGTFPVFYLLHGSGDCDDSWWTVGRAGFILDNLIAANKAKPMIIVMPAGHTRATGAGGRGAGAGGDAFVRDFNEDIMPYVESHYRVIADRAYRAIAGLSMCGMQTRTIAWPTSTNSLISAS